MKYFLAVATCWSMHAMAEEACSSVWIYQAYKSCANAANGLDGSKAGVSQGTIDRPSSWLKGGADQAAVCMSVRNSFNAENHSKGFDAELVQATPVGENTKKDLFTTRYQYACRLAVSSFSFKAKASAACGVEEKWSYASLEAKAQIPGQPICLSCEGYVTSADTVQCLKRNIEQVINTRAVELRDSDIKAVATQIQKMIELNKNFPVEELNNIETQQLFIGVLETAKIIR